MITLPGIDPNMIANNLTPHEPTHPGEFLREEMEYRGISQMQLAKEIGVNRTLLNELINGKRNFTIEYAMMIEAAMGIDADVWMNLQVSYNKNMAKKNSSFMAKLAKIKNIAAIL